MPAASVLLSADPLFSTTHADVPGSVCRCPLEAGVDRSRRRDDERGDTPEGVTPRSSGSQKPPSRPTAMGDSSSLTMGIVAVTMGTDAESRVPSSRTEPSSWRMDGRPGRTGP